MKPDKIYTGRSTIRMFNRDCMELLNSGKTWNLAIVDPPYGIGEDGSKNHTRGKLAVSKNYKAYSSTDNEPPTPEILSIINRVSKNQIVWGANHYLDNFKFNISTPCWIVWDKDNGKTDFADCELAWTSFNSAVRKFKFRWQGMLQENMKQKQSRIHGNEKPIQLYKWLLTNYAKEGDTILDTHGGSMSIAIACWDLGFDLDICELDKDYFDLAVKRFETHITQTQLF